MTRASLIGFGLALAMATGVYLLKDRVQHGEGELNRLRSAIQAELGRLDRLRTEWAVVNRPMRLDELARTHLDLRPLDPTRLVAIDDVPYRDELRLVSQTWSAQLPSGADVALRLKPHPGDGSWAAAAWPGSGGP